MTNQPKISEIPDCPEACTKCGAADFEYEEYSVEEPHGEKHLDRGWICKKCGRFHREH